MRFRSLPIIPRLGHVGPYVPLQLSPHRDRHVDACRLPLSAGFRMGDVSIDGRGGWEGNILRPNIAGVGFRLICPILSPDGDQVRVRVNIYASS